MREEIENIPLDELRKRWADSWGLEPHARIGRSMLEKSLIFRAQSNLTAEQQDRLDQLVKRYKRNPKCFDTGCQDLKPGTRLVRTWKGKRHSVLVKADGFSYQGSQYSSLSQIANNITDKRWNGWLFFGLKK